MIVIGDRSSAHLIKWVAAYNRKFSKIAVLSDTFHSKIHNSYLHALLSLFLHCVLFCKVIWFVLCTKRIFHVHYVSRYSLVSLLIPSKRLVSYIWGSDVQRAPIQYPCLKKVIVFNLNRSSMLVASSPSLIESIALLGVNQSVCEVPFGVPRSLVKMSAEYKITSLSKIRIGCFKYCRIKVYGLDEVLNFVNNLVVRTGLNVELYLIDAGPDIIELKSRLGRLDERVKIIFLPSFTDAVDIVKYFEKIDFSCYLSRRESFGVSVVESFSQGVPVIGARVGGISRLIDHGVDGLFYDSSCISESIDWVLSFISQPEKYTQIALSGLNKVRDNYIWEDNFEKFCVEYRKIFLS